MANRKSNKESHAQLFNRYIWLVDLIYSRKRITFEEIPSGQSYLTQIIEAMRDGIAIEITYHSFWRDHSSTFIIEPYCVKVFKFGVITSNNCNTERIRIKVYDRQAAYIRSLPLHHSQVEIQTEAEYSVFELYIKPTFDLRQEILSHGAEMEVLSPHWFREEIKNAITKQLSRYEYSY